MLTRQPDKTGILLCNLGTPDAPTPAAVRRYLAQFLRDRRVVELSPWIWWPILYGVVLPLRAKRSARLYQKIWNAQGSPLRYHSQSLANKIQTQLSHEGHCVHVALGMCYGQPTLTKALTELMAEKINRLIVLPLYPQYSSSTTAAVFDQVVDLVKKQRAIPAVHFINEYHQHPAYLYASAQQIQQYWQPQSRLLFSFHGIPEVMAAKGDPYKEQCYATAQLLAKELQISDSAWQLVFQSRFGPQPWLQPYCDKTLAQLPKENITNVTLFCPGFAVDCLETLEENNISNRKLFMQSGGAEFHYIPALNDSAAHVDCLAAVVKKYLS